MEVNYYIAATQKSENKTKLLEIQQQLNQVIADIEAEQQQKTQPMHVLDFEAPTTGDYQTQLDVLENRLNNVLKFKRVKEEQLTTLKSHLSTSSPLFNKKEETLMKELIESKVVCERLIRKMMVIVKEMCETMIFQATNVCTEQSDTIEQQKHVLIDQTKEEHQRKLEEIEQETNKRIQEILKEKKQRITSLNNEQLKQLDVIERTQQHKLESIEDEKRKVLAEVKIRRQKLSKLELILSQNELNYNELFQQEKRSTITKLLSNDYYDFIHAGGLQIVVDNLNVLKNWVGLNQFHLVFDSQISGWCRESFLRNVLEKEHLMFINCTDNGDVFGGYINARIVRDNDILDEDHFLFSLYSNGRLNGLQQWKRVKKMTILKNWKVACRLYENDYLYSLGDGDIMIQSNQLGSSRFSFNPISNYYGGLKDNALTGSRDHFNVTRLVVLHFT
ncbi:TLDc domain-containing protein [Entamoeba marina]